MPFRSLFLLLGRRALARLAHHDEALAHEDAQYLLEDRGHVFAASPQLIESHAPPAIDARLLVERDELHHKAARREPPRRVQFGDKLVRLFLERAPDPAQLSIARPREHAPFSTLPH